jgi:DNA polymerase-3 subunit alpha
MIICLDENDTEAGTLKKIHEILRGYPGNRELQFVFSLRDGSRVQLKSNRVRVDITPELRGRVDDLLGPGHLRLIMTPPSPASGKRNGSRRGPPQRD